MDDFLPPGYKAAAEEEEESSSSSPQPPQPPPQPSPTEFKLDLANLFGDIKTDDVASLLPPGYEPPPSEAGNSAAAAAAETTTAATTEKIVLRFPTRPGGIKKVEKPFGARLPSGPPAVVPNIKSFEDR